MRSYKILPGRSRIETEVKSNVHPIHAAGTEVSGVIEGDVDATGTPDFTASHRARIDLRVDSILSGNRLQDSEMQRRMDARKNPNIEITVSRAWMVDGSDRSRAACEVTANGRSHRFEEEFTLQVLDGRLVVEGEHTFDMRDFGVSPPRFLTLKVEPEVKVKLRLEAEEDKRY